MFEQIDPKWQQTREVSVRSSIETFNDVREMFPQFSRFRVVFIIHGRATGWTQASSIILIGVIIIRTRVLGNQDSIRSVLQSIFQTTMELIEEWRNTVIAEMILLVRSMTSSSSSSSRFLRIEFWLHNPDRCRVATEIDELPYWLLEECLSSNHRIHPFPFSSFPCELRWFSSIDQMLETLLLYLG